MKKCVMTFKAMLMASVLFSFLQGGMSYAQANYVGEWYQKSARSLTPVSANLFEPLQTEETNRNIQHLQVDQSVYASILVNHPSLLNLSVPNGNAGVTLNLATVNTTNGEFSVETDKGNVTYNGGVHYRGIVNNNPNSIASISIFNNDIMGFYSTPEGTFTIGKLQDGSDGYCVYNTKELPALGDFNCGAIEVGSPAPTPGLKTTGVGCKTVNIYFECDYKLYQDRGSNTNNVVNYVNGLFNQVATLYANENIDVQISQIFVWTAPDPYASMPGTMDILYAFRTNRGTSFNGNLAHFLTTRSVGGGIAFVDVICNKSYGYGVSMVYNTYNNVPSYSWTVEVVTHELGHNLGSPHTQSCSWPVGPLDNCYAPEGSCATGPAPTNGGTIMSYCHLTSYGINFNNGFGIYPGALIRGKVQNAACIIGSGSTSTPTGLSNTNVTSASAECNWVAVTGATQYTVEYKLASASTWAIAGTTSGTNLTINGLASNSNYEWHVRTDCSINSIDATFTTTGSTGCSTPSALTSSNISQNSATLSWGSVSGASSYTVEYSLSGSNSWTQLNPVTGTSISISGLTAGTNYSWHVKANCSGFSGNTVFTTTSAPTGCNAPSSLSTTNISQNAATLSWNAVSGATNYTVEYRVAGTNSWSSFNPVTGTSLNLSGLSAGITYDWHVKADCSGFSGAVSFTTQLAVSGCPEPSNLTVTNITASTVRLTWTAVPNAQSYSIKVSEVGKNKVSNYNNITSTSKDITGLKQGTSYEWRISTKCGSGNTSNLTDWVGFATLGQMIAGNDMEENISLYPNPAANTLFVTTEGWAADATATGDIYNVQGARVKSFALSAGENSIAINELAEGMYVLYVKKEGQQMKAVKFVKSAH